MTKTQRAVLRWLMAYPGVYIKRYGDGSVSWNAAWADAAARRQMLQMMDFLGGDTGVALCAMSVPEDAGTPRITKQTFLALARRHWICAKKQEVPRTLPRVPTPPTLWYQITARGECALLNTMGVADGDAR